MRMIIAIAETRVAEGRTTKAGRAGKEDGESYDSLFRDKLGVELDELMKFSKQMMPTRFATLSTIALWAGAAVVLPVNLHAADPPDAQPKPVIAQRSSTAGVRRQRWK